MVFKWKATVLTCCLLRLSNGQTVQDHTHTTLTTSKTSSCFIVTAYSVSSTFITDGDCVTFTGTPFTLLTPFSVSATSEPSATDPKWFESIVESTFVTWLPAASTCSVSPSYTINCDSVDNGEPGAVSLYVSLKLTADSNFYLGRAVFSL